VAKFIARDYTIIVNGINLSDHCTDIEAVDNADQIDLTTFGPAAYKQYGQGFHDAQITATFFSDFAAASVHSTLQPLYASGTTFGVEVRPTSAARSATNPAGTMTATLYGYTGIAGAVGAASAMQVTFANAGTSGLVWATA
jgi:hypothetical protein